MPRPGVSKNLRKQLTEFFGERAAYVNIKEDTKTPAGTYSRKRKRPPKARASAIPALGNYGVIPVAGFFILDLDVKKGIEATKNRIKFYEKIFGVKMSDTIGVRTPSGGYHFYIRIPDNAPIFNGNIRSYRKVLEDYLGFPVPELDDDIRSPEAEGYVIGPGSKVVVEATKSTPETVGWYSFIGKSRTIIADEFRKIPMASREGIQLLMHLRNKQISGKRKNLELQAAGEVRRKAREASGEIIIDLPLTSQKPSKAIIAELRQALARKKKQANGDMEFHRQRAFVMGSLQCCYEDRPIALTCIELGIHRDSHTGNEFPLWQLMSDIKSLRVKYSEHTFYCKEGRKNRRVDDADSLERIIADNKKNVRERTLGRAEKRRFPQVVASWKAMRSLGLQDGGSHTQQALDALLLIDLVLQPLTNVGANKVVLAKKPLMRLTGLTESRISAAMRQLRVKKIVEIVDRQQTGLAATYRVTDNYLHPQLSKGIRYHWVKHREVDGEEAAYVYDRFRHGYVNVATEEFFPFDFKLKGAPQDEKLSKAPEVSILEVPRRYLKLD